MSSRPPGTPEPRPAWSVWLRRRWLLVWAWRLLVAPLVSDPKRDAWKSKGEAPVRAMAKRWARRLGVFHSRPRPAVAVFGVLFLAGMVTTRWVVFSLLALAVLWWAPPMWRKYRPQFTGRSMGGGGFNRQPDFDRILEERQGGVTGTVSRGYWRARRAAFVARYVPMAALCVYLAGVFVRHFTDDTLIVAARILF